MGRRANAGRLTSWIRGDFGSLDIYQGIAIVNKGGGTALIRGLYIQTPTSDAVILRGLTFIWNGESNYHAVGVFTVNTLVIDHCDISGFQGGSGDASGTAIFFTPNNAARLEVFDSVLAFDGSSSLGAIHIATQPGGSVSAEIERVRILEAQGNGIRVDSTTSGAGAVKVELRDVTVHASGGGSGIVAVSPTGGGAPAVIYADNVAAMGNAGYGLRAVGGTAKIFLHRSTIANNGNRIGVSSGGAIVTNADNSFFDNANGDGSTTSTLALK